MSIIPRIDERFPEGDDRRQRVTHTLLGEEYGWDSFADINWPMLRQNRDCMENVLSHPEQFPRANVPVLEARFDALDEFLLVYDIGRA